MARKFKSKETEYGYLARMINKGLERIRAKFPESKIVERWSGEFDPNQYAPQKLQKARRLWKSKAITLDAEERSMRGVIHYIREKMGIRGVVNRRNIRPFLKFLDDARARGLGAQYSSEQLIEAIAKMRGQKMKRADILANIDYWANNNLKYDKEGRLIEPDQYKPLNVMPEGSARLEKYKVKMAKREAAERHGRTK